jgi:hypothetical protein
METHRLKPKRRKEIFYANGNEKRVDSYQKK